MVSINCQTATASRFLPLFQLHSPLSSLLAAFNHPDCLLNPSNTASRCITRPSKTRNLAWWKDPDLSVSKPRHPTQDQAPREGQFPDQTARSKFRIIFLPLHHLHLLCRRRFLIITAIVLVILHLALSTRLLPLGLLARSALGRSRGRWCRRGVASRSVSDTQLVQLLEVLAGKER